MNIPSSNVPLWAEGSDAVSFGPLAGTTRVDVAIVGAGFTGLWCALALADADPALTILVIERATVGAGASGRNGGWSSALLPMSLTGIARRHGAGAARAAHRAMASAVREIVERAHTEGIDCDAHQGGTVTLARNPAQEQRLRAVLAAHRDLGLGDDDLRWLDPPEATALVHATRVRGATFTPHCAAIHPGKLVRGLARAATARGVTIVEGTAALRLPPRQVVTSHGTVTADVVVRATEAFTATLPGAARTIVPLRSSMIATEPLAPPTWKRLGLHTRPTFADGRWMIVYGQRTADGRLAFGGRGAPYRYGSRIDPEASDPARVHLALERAMAEMFPELHGVPITHRWGGTLGAARDWWCSVGYDRATGTAWAGGYVGDGVTTSYLAGCTLADLITGRDTDRVHLPWVGHVSPRWEPEPLRWLGIRAGMALAASIDARDTATGRPSPRLRTRLLERLTGA